jgi:hypothetical protein
VGAEVGKQRLVPVGTIAHKLGGQPQFQTHAVDTVATDVDGDEVPPRAGPLALPSVLLAWLLQGAETEADTVELVAREVLP